MNRTSKIYVSGHRGLVGSAILRKLGELGYGNLVYRTHQELDLTRQEKVEEFFDVERPEYVFLAAAKVGGIQANNIYPAEFIYNNLVIQTNVLHSAWKAGAKGLLFLGSSCIYPKHAPQPMKEECILTGRLEPTNEPYAIAKIAGIKLCESYNRQYGTRYRSVMPTNLYGPNDNFDLENSHVIPALIRKFHLAKLAARADWEDMKKDESFYGPIPEDIRVVLGFASQNSNPGQSPQVILWGSGSPRREFLHVDDLASACVFIMALDDSVYDSQTQPMLSHINVGSGKDITIMELAETIKKVVGYEGEIVWDQTRPDGTQQKLLDVSKLTSLGWKAGTTLIEGLRLTYKWYLDQSA